MNIRNRKAQNLIEYILLFAIVCVILYAFLQGRGPFHTRLNSVLDNTNEQINSMGDELRLK